MKRFLFLLACAITLLLNQSNAQTSSWAVQNSGLTPPSPWYEVRFAAVSDNVCWGINIRTSTRITRTTDGGQNWTASSISIAPSTWRNSGISPLDANTAWVLMHDAFGTTNGGLFKTTDGGASWTQRTFPGAGGFPKIIHFFDANVGLCVADPVGGNWVIYRTTDGGDNWVLVPPTSIPQPISGEGTFFLGASSGNSFWFSGGDNIFSFWRLYRTTDRGITWTVRNLDGGTRFPAFSSPDSGMAAGWVPEPRLRRTTDGGNTWTSEPISLCFTPGFFGAVPGSTKKFVMTNGYRPGFSSTPGTAYTTDFGTTWTVVDCVVSRGIPSFASEYSGWSSGDSGAVYKWIGTQLEPPNSHWLTQHTGLPAVTGSPEVFVNAVNAEVCWVLESQNSMYSKTTNGGVTWNVSAVGGAVGLRGSGVFAIDANTAWAAMNDPTSVTSGGIFKTTNGGVGWTRQTAFEGPNGYPNFVYFFNADNGVAAGDPRGGYWEIYTTTNGGAQWNRVPSASIPPSAPGEYGIEDGYRAVGNRIWFINGSGSLYRSTDRGYTWAVTHNVSTGAFAFGFKDSLRGLSIGNPFARTSDGGVTWAPFVPDTFPSNFSRQFLGVVPRPDAWIIASSVAGSSGTAYTTNNGNTWRVVDSALHGRTRFVSNTVGWSAGVNDAIYKWNSNLFVTSVRQTNEVAQGFRLEQNYPNPFNPSTRIPFSVRGSGFVSLKVYDVLGREVRTLVNENLQAGSYETTFDATGLASGVYFYRLQAGDPSTSLRTWFVQTKKLLLMR